MNVAAPEGAIAGEALAQRFLSAVPAGPLPPELLGRARTLRTRCLVGFGACEVLVLLDEGRVNVRTAFGPLTSWDFSVRGTPAGWAAFWAPVPAPGWHDVLALAKRGEFRIEGDLLPFMTHLQFFKDLLALPRGGRHG